MSRISRYQLLDAQPPIDFIFRDIPVHAVFLPGSLNDILPVVAEILVYLRQNSLYRNYISILQVFLCKQSTQRRGGYTGS